MPPTPQAATLVKNVDRPVNKYTGSPQISIPIWQINLKDYIMPIDLNYSPTGVKVEEEASNVGLSWSLVTGGVVTRSVMGDPDDYNKGELISASQDRPFDISQSSEFPRLGRFWSGKYEALRDYDFTNTDANYFYTKIPDIKATYKSSMLMGQNDLEPDVFYFSFGSKSGKFVFDVSGNTQRIVLMPYQDLKISHSLNASGEIISFTITDTDGTIYLFNQIERLERISASKEIFAPNSAAEDWPEPGFNQTITKFNSSWYLSEVKTVNKEVINFYYTDETIDQYDRPGSTAIAKQFTGQSLTRMESNNTTRTKSSSKKRLTKIETSKEEIIFAADHLRMDLNYPASYAITGIAIKQKESNFFIKNFDLSYDYFQSSSSEALVGMNELWYDLNAAQMPSYFKRLKLTQVRERSGEIAQPPYVFSYDERYSLPHRFSFRQDAWGYFNGASTNQSLLPKTYVYQGLYGSDRFRIVPDCNNPQPNEYFIINGADRAPNEDYVKIGTINKIKYPTGGSAFFEYEAHRFLHDGCEELAGGLRVKKISQFESDNYDTPSMVTSYEYLDESNKSSGRIINYPVFIAKTPSTYCFFNNSQVALGTTNGSYVGYEYVKETVQGGSFNGSIAYQYSIPAQLGQNNDPLYNLYNASKVQLNEQTNTPRYIEYLPHMIPGTLPFPPNPDFDWNRGKLIKETVIDLSGRKVKETINNYKIYNALLSMGTKNVFGMSVSSTGNIITFSKYELLTNRANVLDNTVVNSYSYIGGTSASIRQTTNYVYSSNGHVNPVETITNSSDGSQRIEKIQYPLDYSASTPLRLDILTLRNKNMHIPLEELQYIKRNNNSMLISGKLKEFELNGDDLRLRKIYTVENSEPLSNFIPSSTAWEMFIKDSHYRESISFDSYDLSGNIQQLTTRLLNTDSYIYDHQRQHIIFAAKNVKFSDIAFTDFEADGTGNWTYSGQIIAGSSVIGKKCLNWGIGGSISKSGLDPNKTYEVSMWYKSFYNASPIGFTEIPYTERNGWKKYKKIFSGQDLFVYSDIDCQLDQIILTPKGTQFTIYTYTPLVGVTSTTDEKGKITYFDYDSASRLKDIKKENGDLINRTEYHYKF